MTQNRYPLGGWPRPDLSLQHVTVQENLTFQWTKKIQHFFALVCRVWEGRSAGSHSVFRSCVNKIPKCAAPNLDLPICP